MSSLTRKILFVYLFAFLVLVAGLLVLGVASDPYRKNLLNSEIESLKTQAKEISGALAEQAYKPGVGGTIQLNIDLAVNMLQRLVISTTARTIIFDQDRTVVFDSGVLDLLGPVGDRVKVSKLPPLEEADFIGNIISDLKGFYKETISRFLGQRPTVYPDVEPIRNKAVLDVLSGKNFEEISQETIQFGLPIKRFEKIFGAVFITRDASLIDDAFNSLVITILAILVVSFVVTIPILLVFFMHTILRPLRRLANAADMVRSAPGKVRTIPGFENRNDEIGALAADLNAMTDALSQRLDAIENFAADVAHEIKNPLTSLLSSVETAERIKDEDKQKRLMAIIKHDVQRLDRLISDIAEASKLDSELSRDETKILDLEQILSALVNAHQQAEKKEGRQIEFTAISKGPYNFMGNETRILRVFENLMDNAFSFSPYGGLVEVRIMRSMGKVIATIEDEGPGIPERMLKKIFDRFYSERPKEEEFGKHSGLGLSISRQIVEAHQGTISAENKKDKTGVCQGARFIISLPAV